MYPFCVEVTLQDSDTEMAWDSSGIGIRIAGVLRKLLFCVDNVPIFYIFRSPRQPVRISRSGVEPGPDAIARNVSIGFPEAEFFPGTPIMTVRKVKFIAGFAVIVACLVLLVVTSSQKMAMYYLTVSELEARETEFVNKRIKLAGKVTPGSIRKNTGRTVEFQIWEPREGEAFSARRSVVYAGIVPDTFRDEADVVLEGEVGANGQFRAETLLAKCPSKYEGQSYEDIKKAYGR